jgi:hypothetical protein
VHLLPADSVLDAVDMLVREAIAWEGAAGKPSKREHPPVPLCSICAGPSGWSFLAFAPASAYRFVHKSTLEACLTFRASGHLSCDEDRRLGRIKDAR